MNRRDFLQSLAGAAGLIACGSIPEEIEAEVTRKFSLCALNFKDIEINIGLEKEFKALHISDSHLIRCDKRDDELKRKLATLRYTLYPWAENCLNASIEHAKRNNMQLIHTGDIYDMITEADLDLAGAYFKANDWLTAVGNHEFNIYLQEARPDAAYKAKSFDIVQSAFPSNIDFSSRVVNGVNFVNIDNSFFYVTEKQHELMEKEMAKGLPVILLCHIPFYTPKHALKNMGKSLSKVNLCGAPREITDKLTGIKSTSYTNVDVDAEWRKNSVFQRADDTTLEFTKWLKDQKMLKGILCGHCHHYYIEQFSPTAVEYCVDANYKGGGFNITFK